jgi:hypothetical protein
MTDSFMHKHQASLDSQREETAIKDLEDAGVYPNVFENSILIEDKDFPYEEEEYEKYID